MKVAEAISLDKSKVQENWSPNPDDMKPFISCFLRLYGSNGIKNDRVIDTAKEAEKWKVEFGGTHCELWSEPCRTMRDGTWVDSLRVNLVYKRN